MAFDPDWLAQLRGARGWSQSDLASFLNKQLGRGYNGNRVSQWENGRRNVPVGVRPVVRRELFGEHRGSCDIIAVANQKGGAGKTTTALNLGYIFGVLRGLRTLVVDADQQSNATQGVGFNPWRIREQHTLVEVIERRCRLQEAVYATDRDDIDVCRPGLSIVPARPDLSESEKTLIQSPTAFLALKNALDNVADDFDVIIIDCAPGRMGLAQAAIAAANKVLIPSDTGTWSPQGIPLMADEVREMRQIRQQMNASLDIVGVLPTTFRKGRVQHEQSLTDIADILAARRETADKPVFDPVPYEEIFQRAAGADLIAAEVDHDSAGVAAYIALADRLRPVVRNSDTAREGVADAA